MKLRIFTYTPTNLAFSTKNITSFFVFGGVIFLSRSEREANERKYLHAEREIRKSENIPSGTEVKATSISNKGKGKLFRSLNNVHKFGIIVRQNRLNYQIFAHKKTKQRYLDWAFKMAVKRKLEALIEEGLINPDEVENLYIFSDEHTTATNGKYEIHESLEEEFKHGMFNRTWSRYYPPLFPNLKSVQFSFCNSSTKTLVRAADIVANKLYFCATKGIVRSIQSSNFHITYHPRLR